MLVVLFAIRLDFGLGLTIFVIPFWNYPKTLFGGFQLSPVEVLTWVAVTAWTIDTVLTRAGLRLTPRIFSFDGLRSRLTALDWAVLVLLLLALVSTRWAANFGVASREFRIIILDPILLYALVRVSDLAREQTRRLVYALLASGVAVSAVGLYRLLTGDSILADGVLRLTAVWGSPNNVGLYLGRLLPLALAFTFLLRGWRERWVYAALVILFGVTILLTYSRGALFLGLPASILFLLIVLFTQSHPLSRRAWFAIGLALGIGVLVLIPFLASERFWSIFQPGTGTGFFRLALWSSAIRMGLDHPILGVGLDNFLYEYPKYILPVAWREPNLSHPHNIILDFWVRLGIGGLVLIAWLLVAFFRRAWSSFRCAADLYVRALMLGLMASMVDFIAHGMIDAAFFVIDLAYVFMLTLALAQIKPDTGPGRPDQGD
jgi:O-antigen ligase